MAHCANDRLVVRPWAAIDQVYRYQNANLLPRRFAFALILLVLHRRLGVAEKDGGAGETFFDSGLGRAMRVRALG
jgi:hypothetical protein